MSRLKTLIRLRDESFECITQVGQRKRILWVLVKMIIKIVIALETHVGNVSLRYLIFACCRTSFDCCNFFTIVILFVHQIKSETSAALSVQRGVWPFIYAPLPSCKILGQFPACLRYALGRIFSLARLINHEDMFDFARLINLLVRRYPTYKRLRSMTLCLTLYRVSQICQNLGVRLGGKFRVCLNLLLNYIAADLRPIA